MSLARWTILPLLRALGALHADTAARAGGALGVAAFHLGLRRRTVSANLRDALGLSGRRRRAIARRSYASIGANFLQLWTIGSGHGPEAGLRVANPGWLAHLRRRHPSLVVVLPHLGDWEMGGHGAARFQRVVVYAKPQGLPEVDAAINAQRRRGGFEVVLTGEGDRTGALTVLRALRDGCWLGLLADQRPGHVPGQAAWFLGRPVRCHAGPAFFARRLGVPVVPGVAIRTGAGRSVLFFGRPILPPLPDEGELTQRCMDRLSAMIAAFPGQYFWHHRRFKRLEELPPRGREPWRERGLRLLVERGGAA